MDSNDKWYTYNQDNGLYIGYEIESQYYQNSSNNNYIWNNNNYDRYIMNIMALSIGGLKALVHIMPKL